MAYVQRSDYSRVISNNDLRELLEDAHEYFQGKDENQVLTEAGNMSQSKINMILGGTFDLTDEFNKDATAEPDTREQNILRCYLHIAVYWLNFVINPRDIPELRQMAYDNCIQELEDLRDGKLHIDLPQNEGTSRLSQISGAAKFISRPFSDPLVLDTNNDA